MRMSRRCATLFDVLYTCVARVDETSQYIDRLSEGEKERVMTDQTERRQGVINAANPV